MRTSSTLAVLLAIAPLVGARPVDGPPRALETTSSDGRLELRIHDPRGDVYDEAFESVVELRRDGKRAYRRRFAFGVRHVGLHLDGRVVLAGEARREVHGLDADVAVLCFLDAKGETLAVHEEASLRRPRRRAAHGVVLCGMMIPPPPDDLPLSVDQLLPMDGDWTLAVASRRVDGKRELRWQVFYEDGDRVGEVGEPALLPEAYERAFTTSLCVLPGTRWVVATWLAVGADESPHRLTIHDLGACFAAGPARDSLEPLRNIPLVDDVFHVTAEYGDAPRVVVALYARRDGGRGFTVSRGPGGEVLVERLADDD